MSKSLHNNSRALRWAAGMGHTECVKMLIPVSDPKYNDSAALRDAAIMGHTECVKLLIPISNPKDCNSEALVSAAQEGHEQCANLLYDLSDVPTAIAVLKIESPANYTQWQFLEQRWEAEHQHKVLSEYTHHVSHSSVPRKL